LITYTEDFGWWGPKGEWVSHHDPYLGPEEYSYCTAYERLLKCGRDNYVFFHTTKTDPVTRHQKRFITAYFVIKAVGPGKQIVPKYGITKAAKHAENRANHYVIVGDKRSRKLKEPGLRFDRPLAKKLVFDPPKRIRFGITNKHGDRLSELQCIASATRNIRILTDEDVDNLRHEINRLGL